MNKKKAVLAILIVLVLSTTIAMAQVRANPVIRYCRAVLMADKSASLSIYAKLDCESIGTVKCVLYRDNGSLVKSMTVADYGSGFSHTSTVDLSNHISNGESYYVIAYFSADGETANVTSGVRSY